MQTLGFAAGDVEAQQQAGAGASQVPPAAMQVARGRLIETDEPALKHGQVGGKVGGDGAQVKPLDAQELFLKLARQG